MCPILSALHILELVCPLLLKVSVIFIYIVSHLFKGFPCGSTGKESACNMGDLGLIPGLGRSHGEGNDYPLQYYGLENSMDRGGWWATFPGVTKRWT